jgi:60 kDa SS-A/Ro ribonucleoprotein
MSNPYSSSISPVSTPQSEPLFTRSQDQTKNRAGGYVFKLDPWDVLDRFLILGTEGGTYYATERALTRESIHTVLSLISEDGLRVVNRIVEISDSGRAARNTSAIFALAAASVYGNLPTKQAANKSLSKVCRIGTHLFQWAESIKALNGHGPSGAGQRRALSHWYTDKSADNLAYDLVKYQQREGWSHRDLLRLCKPGSKQVSKLDNNRKDIYALRSALGWATGHPLDIESGPGLLACFELAKTATSEKEIANLILTGGLTREMIPTQWLNSPLVWESLLFKMPLTAMIRNLGKMSSIGLLKPLSEAENIVTTQLVDIDLIRKARLHPVAILNAFKVYGSGTGVKGSLTWIPSQSVLSSLEQSFDLSFQTINPIGKRLYISIDGSGSMAYSNCIGLESISCVEGAAAMAMVTARKESRYYISGFDTRLKPLTITKNSSMREIVSQLGYGGGTDASIPFKHAIKDKLEVDSFVVYTDNETWHGDCHPSVALDQYRQKMGINAKLVVVSMAVNEYSIGDSQDPGTMNVVGFDSAAPSLISDFVSK